MWDRQGIARLTYEASTVLAIVLLSLYATHRAPVIPLTYLTPFSDWGGIRGVFSSELTYTLSDGSYNISSPSWALLAGAAWCDAPSSSPQCACLFRFYRSDYPDLVARYDNGSLTLPALQDASYQQALASCLRERPTWRKDTCSTVCSVHLATPVLLICLFASLFLSRVSEYDTHALNLLACYAPTALAVLTFILLLVFEGVAGLPPSLAILGVLLEASFFRPSSEAASAFHSYQRFLLALLAAWAAVTHQARDLYLAPAYGTLGFFLGTFAYYSHLVRPFTSPIPRALSVYLWVGGGAILAGLVLLVQQHWLPSSPAASSVVSVAALFILAPLSLSPCQDAVRMAVSLTVVCACFLGVVVDVVGR